MRQRLLYIILGIVLASPLPAQNKAVLFGVSDYPEGSGWCHLSSHNDVSLLISKLPKTVDIISLEDNEATHSNIIKTLKSIANSVSKGDTVFIHFSCHGQQMLPASFQDKEPDGLDEAIIPFDAKMRRTSSYNGENHLRDNELSDLIDGIRNQLGANGLVFVSLDACHSDSMDKGVEDSLMVSKTIYRGTSEIFGDDVPEDVIRLRYKRDTSTVVVNNNAAVVYLSACQTHSRNAEIIANDGIGYGSLSYALAQAFDEAYLSDIGGFIDCIIRKMDKLVPYQTPGVRASFVYDMPELQSDTSPALSSPETTGEKRIQLPLIIALTVIMAGIIIWIITKRK